MRARALLPAVALREPADSPQRHLSNPSYSLVRRDICAPPLQTFSQHIGAFRFGLHIGNDAALSQAFLAVCAKGGSGATGLGEISSTIVFTAPSVSVLIFSRSEHDSCASECRAAVPVTCDLPYLKNNMIVGIRLVAQALYSDLPEQEVHKWNIRNFV